MFKRILKSQERQRLVMWVLLIAIVLPMILFFQGGLASRRGPGGAAGVLFGREIPWDVFDEERRFIRRSLAAPSGDAPEGFESVLNRRTWDRLMLREEARRRSRVTDQELAQYLHQQPAFQQGGRFLPDLYFRWVRGMGLTPQQFEERLQDDLRIQRLLDHVRSEVASEHEAHVSAWLQSLRAQARLKSFVEEPADKQ